MKKIKRDVKFPHPVQGMEYNIWVDKSSEYDARVLSEAECCDAELKKIDH